MSSEKGEPKYTLSVDLNVLRHLGLNLYSNVPAVLSEVIANSWDADADSVRITLEPGTQRIVIRDDGVGMDQEDINTRYLKVGYQKRADATVTPTKHRHVMGRKGIGKLSLFSIANKITVRTAKTSPGGLVSRQGFLMTVEAIQEAIKSGQGVFHPTELEVAAADLDMPHGTEIVLEQLRSKVTAATEKGLRTRLARRFSVIGKEAGFAVFMNNKEITAEDRDYFKRLEFIWTIGDGGEQFATRATNAKKTAHMDGTVDLANQYKVSGWVGTFDEQKNIEEGDNSIVVLAWGKLVQEDILSNIQRGGLFTKYLCGEIRADFLDLDDKEDIATSDRQRLKEDDPRFVALKDFVDKQVLREIEKVWRDWRGEIASEKAFSNQAIKDWFAKLGSDNKKYARQLFAKIESFPIADPSYKRELYRHGVLAFEKLALRQNLDALDKLTTQADFELLGAVFSGIDELEAAQYHGIVRGRLDVIKAFKNMLPDAKEKVLQKHLFDHLWLLHPSWERASTNTHIEEAVTKEFANVSAGLSEPEKAGRIDIRYKTAAGKHIIVELKRYNVQVSVHSLSEQLRKYYRALEKCLRTQFPNESRVIECIAVLGSPPTPHDDDQINRKVLEAEHARYITYDTLIAETLDSYQDYVEADKKISSIVSLVESI